MVVTLGQQYNVGEKPTVILYTYINRHAAPDRHHKQNKNNVAPGTSSYMVVIIYCYLYIGYQDYMVFKRVPRW